MTHRTALEGYRVLILAPFGQDAASVDGLLTRDGYQTGICRDLDDLARRLDELPGAVLLTEEALRGGLDGLAAAVKGQPAWSDVPFILLAGRQTGPVRASEATRLRLPAFATNVMVLERPLSSVSLMSAVASALRSRQKQFEMRDRIAQLAASEAALREESRALETLNSTGQQVAAELDLDRLVQSVVDAGVALTGAGVGAFFHTSIDESGEGAMLYALSGVARDGIDPVSLPPGTAFSDPAFAGTAVMRSDDITREDFSDQSDTPWGLLMGTLAVTSSLAAPVVSRSGAVIGCLLFGHERAGVFTARSERLAIGLAAQAAIAIDNARLFRDAQRMNQTLEEKVVERTAALNAEMANRARIEAALHQSQKMEAVGQLTGGIAHDFNNMLTGIIGSLDLVKRRMASGRSDGIARYMDAASSSAQRAAALTARLLAFSRRQSLDPKPTDVSALIHSLEDLLRRTISERVALRIVTGPAAVTAIADANQLESAILNLAINARDAMPDGGQLTVEAEVVRIDAAQLDTKPGLTPGRYVVVAVSDTGVGMTPDILEKAFDPFFTTKPIGQGTGLGLSMVYGFAQQSNGQVRVHSAPGAGTSVKIYLPVAETPAVAPSEIALDMPVAGRGQRVLVVEDDDAVRLLVRSLLEELGYDPIEAGEANGAIRILESGQPLDLMISDVGLPGMNGRQLAEVARQHRPDLPILFVTGYAENAAIRAGFLGTNMDMITKPFAPGQLVAKIQQVLEAPRVTV